MDLAGGGRDAVDDGLEQLGHALAGLAADGQHLGGVDAEGLLDLGLDLVGPAGLHVDLVQRRDDREVGVDGGIGVGDGLSLDALGGVDQEDRALAGGEAARDLVVEIDVPRRVDQVQLVIGAFVAVVDRDGAGLDGDPALAFEVHVVEQLLAELALGDGTGLEEQLIGERALAVVDVGDDREVSDVFGVERHEGPDGEGPCGPRSARGSSAGEAASGAAIPLHHIRSDESAGDGPAGDSSGTDGHGSRSGADQAAGRRNRGPDP